MNISWSGNFTEAALRSGINYFTIDGHIYINGTIVSLPNRYRVDTQVGFHDYIPHSVNLEFEML